MAKPKAFIPKTLAACADALFKTRAERLAQQKIVDALKEQESALQNHLIDSLSKGDASGIAGKLCSVQVVVKTIPQVENWPAFYAFIAKTKAFDLLQRRVSDSAVRERWEGGKDVPGVVAFNNPTLSIHQLK